MSMSKLVVSDVSTNFAGENLTAPHAGSAFPEPDGQAASQAACMAPLLAHLERIDLLLQRRMQRMRSNGEDKYEMQHLVLSEEALDLRIRNPLGMPQWLVTALAQANSGAPGDKDDGTTEGRGSEVAASERDASLGILAASPDGEDKLAQLTARFGLSDFERDVLLLSALPLFDSRYRLLLSYLQDEKHKQWPGIDLALSLFCDDAPERFRAHAALLPEAILQHHRLLVPAGRRMSSGEGVNGFQMSPAVFSFLLGAPRHVPADPAITWLNVDRQAGLTLHPGWSDRLAQLLDKPTQGAQAVPVIMLRGIDGSGRAASVAVAASIAGRAALCVDLKLMGDDDEQALEVLAGALRDSVLADACLLFRDVHAFSERRPRLFAQMASRLSACPLPLVCLIGAHAPVIWIGQRPQLVLDFPSRTPDGDGVILKRRLGRAANKAELDLAGVARRFRLSADTLTQTLDEADLYRSQRAFDAELSNADLYAAFGRRAQQNFGKLAQRVMPQRGFDDLIVSDELMQQLREILSAIRHRDQILAQGFGRKVNYGLGISVLFHGDSGTGKTMVAEVLAGALGVDLIKVDLSTVVNKYIGETEKNISRIFDLAGADAGVLFFDEADALFGKRSETKDAQDRHANIEVSYLLQRLESYPGLVVLATNNRNHLDEAFTRRLTFITRFAFPDATLRERMWRSIWPPGQALAVDIDFVWLAQQAKLTGANIRNIALLASWLAASDDSAVSMSHIELALRRELEKLGRLSFSLSS